MTLHTVNKNANSLQRCLNLARETDAVLLIEDGVYASFSNQANKALWAAVPAGLSLYALEDDLAARGITDNMLPGIEPISWQKFVALTCENDKVISWG